MKAKQKREDVNRKRRIWVKNSLQLRPVVGIEEKLLTQLLTEHGDGFKNFLRMDQSRFLMLHNMLLATAINHWNISLVYLLLQYPFCTKRCVKVSVCGIQPRYMKFQLKLQSIF
ncbi:hypothetical protein NQ318_021853 [Aromia moschata]|uniref:Uncharacterized protein n=1 Tax=Aromia moschata TaxID=1265417 RepID=A0AAV8Z8U0_9CUCU|nr:hypothetical protein NQ318_021853 [Aromia moschata]